MAGGRWGKRGGAVAEALAEGKATGVVTVDEGDATRGVGAG